MSGSTYTIRPSLNESLIVDGQAGCGMVFPRVALIHDWRSENPGLELFYPLGIDGVEQIVKAVREYKAAEGSRRN